MDILERLRSVQNTCVQYVQGSDIMRDAADEIAKLRTQLGSATREAERYRWLKYQHERALNEWHVRDGAGMIPDDLDVSIDMARSATPWQQSIL